MVDESPDLVNPNFINLTDSLPPSERYSFVFEGTPQALDHVLVNTRGGARSSAAMPSRATTPTSLKQAAVRRRRHQTRAQLGSRHAGRLLRVPAVGGRVGHRNGTGGTGPDRRGLQLLGDGHK